MPLCTHCLDRLDHCLYQLPGGTSASQGPPSSPADLKESLDAACSICTYLWNFACKIRPDPICPTAWELIAPAADQGQVVTFELEHRPDNNHNFPYINTSIRLKAAVQTNGVSKDTVIKFGSGGMWTFELVPKANIRSSRASARKSLPLPELDYGSTSADTNTGDSAVLAVINDWISDCTLHRDCMAYKQPNWMPRRLLDVQTGQPNEFRLVSEAPSAPYLTLSHRWGSAQFLQLRKGNAQQLASGQPDEVLPQTFQDAILVCRTIGVRYIWIDSLCIVQDDAADWAEQALQLSSVYSHGLCNLAADETEADKGLFRQRCSSIVAPIHYEVTRSSLDSIPVGVYELVEDRQGGVTRLHMTNLISRGWVYQERALARRIVHFLDDRLIWECSTRIAQEAQPYGVEVNGAENFPAWSKSLKDFNTKQTHNTRADDIVCGINCDFCEQWRIIVHDFTDTALTKKDDRPMAIAGLAARIQDMSGEEYQLGFFRKHIRHQLMWTVDTGGYVNKIESISPGSTRHFPSFSWLSMDSGIEFQRQDARMTREFDFEVIDLEISELEVCESRELIQKAKLKLLGTLRSVYFTKDKDETQGQIRYWMRRDSGSKLATNVFPSSFDNLEATMANIAISGRTSDYFLLRLTVDGVLRKTSDGYGKPWYEVREYKAWWLILEPVDNEQAIFRRVGILSTWPRDTKELSNELESDTKAPGLLREGGKRICCIV